MSDMTAPQTKETKGALGRESDPMRRRPTLLELRSGQCRYPVGAPMERARFFCGKPTLLPKPYCRECCQRAYVTIRTR